MARSGNVYCHGILAGVIEETPDGYRFTYDGSYLASPSTPAVSLTLPKRPEPFVSKTLFGFFFGLLAEGSLKDLQCRKLRLDENDHFGRLLATTHDNTIGAVTVQERR